MADFTLKNNKYSLFGDVDLDELAPEMVADKIPKYKRTQMAADAMDTGFDAETGANIAGAVGKTAMSGGSGADLASAGLMASGNPYLIAAGAGLGVLSGASKNRQMRERERIANEMDRRQRVMTAMSQLGTGVGSIG